MSNKGADSKSTNQRTAILAYLAEHDEAKTMDVYRLLLVKETRAKNLLREMVKNEVLVVEGDRRGRTYRRCDFEE